MGFWFTNALKAVQTQDVNRHTATDSGASTSNVSKTIIYYLFCVPNINVDLFDDSQEFPECIIQCTMYVLEAENLNQ